MRRFLLLYLLFAKLGISFANQSTIPHQYIVQLVSVKTAHQLFEKKELKDAKIESLHDGLHYYLITFSTTHTQQEEVKFLKSQPSILSFSPNKKLSSRSCKPNDPYFKDQWNLSFMGFEDVWCFDKGGVSPLGDTLAIGLIDFGFDYLIPDLQANLFRNRSEVADNDLDDDGNGYVDDFIGFNAIAGKSDHHDRTKNHGTNVLSLISAKGNNNQLISGTNITMKTVICSAENDAHLIKCYSYFIKLRKDYLQSNGQKGAFIVSSSLSLGYDTDFIDQHPALCSMYDQLGETGILNVCATVNLNVDIDTNGDVPSLCPSPYLISVTNTDRSDTKVEDAGYSKQNIDLAASGEMVPVIGIGGIIQMQSGCSLSAPQVAGGIAYLNQYCEKFAMLSKTDPAKASLLMKEFVLNGGKSIPALQQYTVSGKRFNIFGSLKGLLNYCNLNISQEIEVEILPNPVEHDLLKVNIDTKSFDSYQVQIFNVSGQGIYQHEYEYEMAEDHTKTIDIQSLLPGVYFLMVKTQNTFIGRKFLKLDE